MNTDLPFPELKKLFADDPLALVGQVPGLLPVNKPSGMTSHDVVAIARRKLQMKKIGHGGTLDPMAEGLLLLMLGRATRLFDALQGFKKTYIAELRFGLRTDTQDITGEVLSQVPEGEIDLEKSQVASALEQFRGEINQVPPMFSALKKNGVPLHKLARQGKEVAREPRPVTVYELELLKLDPLSAQISMTVSKGFYVRTLIDDLGASLGCGATMTALKRTHIGPFHLNNAVLPDDIAISGA